MKHLTFTDLPFANYLPFFISQNPAVSDKWPMRINLLNDKWEMKNNSKGGSR